MSFPSYSLVCLTILGSLLVNTVGARIARLTAHRRLLKPYEPLPDIVHRAFPPFLPVHLPDFLIAFGTLIVSLNWRSTDANLQCLLACSIALWARSVTIVLTTLPSPVPRRTVPFADNPYTYLFCSSHDLVFSGHTVVMNTIGSLIWNIDWRDSRVLTLCQLCALMFRFVFPFSLAVVRQHYTIDVVVAIIAFQCSLASIQVFVGHHHDKSEIIPCLHDSFVEI